MFNIGDEVLVDFTKVQDGTIFLNWYGTKLRRAIDGSAIGVMYLKPEYPGEGRICIEFFTEDGKRLTEWWCSPKAVSIHTKSGKDYVSKYLVEQSKRAALI